MKPCVLSNDYQMQNQAKVTLTKSWAQDPPREFLGLKAQILAKNCKSDVKTPNFVGVDRKVANDS